MRKKNIRKLIAFLSTLPSERFNMRYWINYNGEPIFSCNSRGPEAAELLHDCGTVACIGGYAELLSGHDPKEFLGLRGKMAKSLFKPEAWYWAKFTTEDAVQVLNNLLETGKVDWSIVPTKATLF